MRWRPWSAAVAAVALAALQLPTSAAAEEAPDLFLTPSNGPVGTKVAVAGKNWPAGIQLQVVLCGNQFLGGFSDCDLAGGGTTNVLIDGTWNAMFIAGQPPKPCPCVVHVSSPDDEIYSNFPFDLFGTASATPVAPVKRTFTATTLAQFSGTGPPAAWFGAPPQRLLRIEVENTGNSAIPATAMTVALGQGDQPSKTVAQPPLETIPPGGTAIVEVPLALPAFAVGKYTALVTLPGLDAPATAVATTSSYPWAVVLGAWLLIQIPLLGIWRRRPDPAAPEDPLAERLNDLVMPQRDFGVSTVRDLVDPYADAYAAMGYGAVPAPLIVVGGVQPKEIDI